MHSDEYARDLAEGKVEQVLRSVTVGDTTWLVVRASDGWIMAYPDQNHVETYGEIARCAEDVATILTSIRR